MGIGPLVSALLLIRLCLFSRNSKTPDFSGAVLKIEQG